MITVRILKIERIHKIYYKLLFIRFYRISLRIYSLKAVILKRFNRYPLIIDPSGQATNFILNQYVDRKITRTSFMDDNFLKCLESSLRFGNALLVSYVCCSHLWRIYIVFGWIYLYKHKVDDVENIDPVLNPVLNYEIQKVGGRVIIRVGKLVFVEYFWWNLWLWS